MQKTTMILATTICMAAAGLAPQAARADTLESPSLSFPAETPAIGKHALAPALRGEGAAVLTPEMLWEMGRVGNLVLSPDGKSAVYTVTYQSVEQNKSRTVVCALDLASKASTSLTPDDKSQTAPAYIDGGRRIAFMEDGELWVMDADGSDPCRLLKTNGGIGGFLFSPDGEHVVVVYDVPSTVSIKAKEDDLPKSSGMVVHELMYKHWDTYSTSVPHPFLCTYDGEQVVMGEDILAGEPFEAPTLPFGGVEQFAFSPDGRTFYYTSRKLTGKDYALSTDSDIYAYSLVDGSTQNLCKPTDYVRPAVEETVSLASQAVNASSNDLSMGYDRNPSVSPDGNYIAWLSQERDGYESDRVRLCLYNNKTGKKTYLTDDFDSWVDGFVWSPDSRQIYFTGAWHGATQIYRVDLKGKFEQLTNDWADFRLCAVSPDGRTLYAKKHSISQADELYRLSTKRPKTDVDGIDVDARTGATTSVSSEGISANTYAAAEQLTFENADYYAQLSFGKVEERWVKTTDGKEEQCWVIYPPFFDESKKYPALLYCQGGPQQTVSQFWSTRWNFQLMAANGYIVIAPNRRGLPGYGQEWNEAISGDYTGQCMQDYLSAIDDLCQEPYVDRDHLGCVGASFGGYSVYYLAGNHEGRFKCFIAHDGIFNTEMLYYETEEMWFPNWDMGGAPWRLDASGRQASVYERSPHRFVDHWDTPILCISGQKDFRIEYTQSEAAFAAARMRGIPAQLLLFPDENHWVLKPQNGILWQRTFFRWLDKWLKN